jgi:hypothetical protein
MIQGRLEEIGDHRDALLVRGGRGRIHRLRRSGIDWRLRQDVILGDDRSVGAPLRDSPAPLVRDGGPIGARHRFKLLLRTQVGFQPTLIVVIGSDGNDLHPGRAGNCFREQGCMRAAQGCAGNQEGHGPGSRRGCWGIIAGGPRRYPVQICGVTGPALAGKCL